MFRFLLDEGLNYMTFGEVIGKDIKRVAALVEHPASGLTSHEHSRLCRKYGRGKVSTYYILP